MDGYLVLVRHLRGDVPVFLYADQAVAVGAAEAFCPDARLNQYRQVGASDVGRPVSCDVVQFVNGYPKQVVHSHAYRANAAWDEYDE